MKYRGRSRKGAVMGLVAASGLVLAIVVAAFFMLSMLMGGGREIHNATDAGALNLGKEIFTNENFKVKRAASSFSDLVDKHGEFGLANINSVWGKALLVQANAEAMQADGLGGNAGANADSLFAEAKNISEELAGKLNNERNQYEIFESVAGQNSVRMLGLGASVEAQRDAESWSSSLMDRGAASNIEVNAAEIMPTDASYRALQLTDSRIPGYTPIRIGGKTFCFVPFADKERTHLVSLDEFKANMESAKALEGPQWGESVPNSFSCKGKTQNQFDLAHFATACVVANPQRTYKLSMPHSFLQIHLAENRAKWLFNSPDPRVDGFNVGLSERNGSYNYRLDPTSKSGGLGSAVDGSVEGRMVPLGQEYSLNPSLDKALFGTDLQRGDRAKLERTMVQRINQMISEVGVKFDKDDLHRLLSRESTGLAMQAGGDQDYYIFSPDGRTIDVERRELAVARAPWLANMINNGPDGSAAGRFVELESDMIVPPGLAMVDPLPGANIVVPAFGRLNVEITNSWKPGTGYGGCLGRIDCTHQSKVYLWGVAIIPAAPGGGLLGRLRDLF